MDFALINGIHPTTEVVGFLPVWIVNGLPRIREILGETGFATLEVREIECYENGDAKGIYVE
jgi:hypothetical protein